MMTHQQEKKSVQDSRSGRCPQAVLEACSLGSVALAGNHVRPCGLSHAAARDVGGDVGGM